MAATMTPSLIDPLSEPTDTSSPEQPDTKAKPEQSELSDSSTPTTALSPLPHPSRASSIPVPAETPSSSLQAPPTPLVPLSPARRRPKPPTKGILKPPPPPPKPTLGNRLRDLAANVVGGPTSGTATGRGFFDSDDVGSGLGSGSSAGPSGLGSPGAGGLGSPGSVTAAVGGTLGALGGRIGMGLSRFVASATSPVGTPTGSPMSRTIGLPDIGGSPSGLPVAQPASEKAVPRKQRGPLRRATFVLPSLSITYPISSQGEPWSTKVIEDRKRIESSHRTLMSVTTGAEYWTAARLVKLYETACKGREEKPRVGIVRALEVLPRHPRPRVLHLTLRPDPQSSSLSSSAPSQTPAQNTLDTPLNRHAAEALADVLSSEWALSDVRLENGIIEDDLALKPILHALLVSGTLPSLSLAGNRKVRERGWRLLAVFLKKARSLKYVDLSDTTWDRRSIDYLVQALTATAVRSPSPSLGGSMDRLGIWGHAEVEAGGDEEREPLPDCYGSFVPHAPLLKDSEDLRAAGLQTLRMDGCTLRASLLEPLAAGIRSSDIRNLSLRRNKIGPVGAVALALMIRDYPDSSSSSSSSFTPFHPASSTSSLLVDQPNGTAPTPYTPRPRRTMDSLASSLGSPTDLTRGLANGHVRVHPNGPPVPPKHALSAFNINPDGNGHGHGHGHGTAITAANAEGRMSGPDPSTGGASVALQRQVRSLDGVERIGRLLTLDLKGNEIKNGVTYIAQVLKRNRTLKVLNLSDNRIDPPGLLALADALKYNSTLETLDLSSNPCCGPSLEGITALRTAFTANTSLKRLFLSETNLHPEGAIALAEFLPESHSLLHLDLTSNPLDVAGVLALSSGLKSNTVLRCLDVSIPPNNPDLADLSQGILQTCIRNTELAAAAGTTGTGKGGEGVWGPIKKSVLVRQVKEAELFRAEQERLGVMSSPEGLAREYVYKLTPERLVPVCETTGRDLERWLAAGEAVDSPLFSAWEPGQLPREEWRTLWERAKALRERLADEIPRLEDEAVVGRMLELNDSLGAVLDEADKRRFVPPPRLLLPSQIVASAAAAAAGPGPGQGHENGKGGVGMGIGQPSPMTARHRRHMRGTSLEISSPNFSIGDSDNDSDAEELDVGRLPPSPQPPRARGRSGSSGGAGASGYIGSGSGANGNGKGTATVEDGRGARPTPSDLRLEAEDEAEQALREAAISSPVERVGRAWMEEEGEVFRKGSKLGVGAEATEDDEDGDGGDGEGGGRGLGDEGVSGEVLRQEILETEVARSPARRVLDADGEEEDGGTKVEDTAQSGDRGVGSAGTDAAIWVLAG